MCLHGRRFSWTSSVFPRSDELSYPSLPSTWPSKGPRRRRVYSQGQDLFARALECSLRTIPISKSDTESGHWLAALAHLEAVNCAGWLDHVEAQRSSVRNDITKEQQQLSEQASDLCKTLQSDISQLIALQRTPSVDIQFSDYEEQLLMLERLLGEAKVIAAEIKESLDMQHRAKNIQVAELAINESRSAIAGTSLLG